MLANNLTLDDEESVQAELKELQDQAVSISYLMYSVCSFFISFVIPTQSKISNFLQRQSPSRFILVHQVRTFYGQRTILTLYAAEPAEQNAERARVPILA